MKNGGDYGLKRFWMAALAILAASVIISTGRASKGFVDWLTEYQTLVTGLLAVGAAVWTIDRMNRAMRQEREFHEENQRRDLEAARSLLPLALTKVVEYAETCLPPLESILDSSLPGGRGLLLVPADYAVPATPAEVLEIVRDCIRSAEPSHARRLQELIAAIQIQNSRVREARPGDTQNEHWTKRRILDTAEVHARAEALFDFARGRPSSIEAAMSWRMSNSLALMSPTLADHHPDIDRILITTWQSMLDR